MQKRYSKKIVMLGTRFDTMGGISSVVNVYRSAGFFDQWPIDYIATHCDGSRLAKLITAISAFFHFINLILFKNIGAVHIHVSSGPSFWRKFIFLFIANLFGIKFILHLHSGRFNIFYDQQCGETAKKLVRFAFNQAASVIVLSDGWKKWLQTISSNRNISIVHNPVEIPSHTITERFSHHRVVSLGRVCQAKGSYDLLQATVSLKGLDSKLEVILAGDGEIDTFSKEVAHRGMDKTVLLPGWIRGKEKQNLLDTASIYALPSYGEGLPMGLLEAMANGIPVVSTRVGGIPETINDGIDGFLINPGDIDALIERLSHLLSDQKLASTMGMAAREKIVKHFSPQAILPQIGAIYSQLGAKPA